MSLQIESFALGDWMTNCYVLSLGEGGPCWMIDAGFDPQPMLDYITQHRLTPEQVVLTHAHVDHIAGLHAVRQVYPDIPIVIHEAEREFLTDASLNLSIFLTQPIVAPEPTGLLAHGDHLTFGDLTLAVRHTPGHSPGGICLYQQEHHVAIVGDTLFQGSIGRSDFPTSDGATLLRSIREQLLTLPDDTHILPGHGPETTIAQERRSNPFLQ